MQPPFFVDNNTLDYFEDQLLGAGGNEVRVLLLEAIEKGDLIAPFPIRDEYKAKSDPPIFIQDQELVKVFVSTKGQAVAKEMTKIALDHPKLTRRAQRTNKDPGDPWLLANAALSEGTVVTEEVVGSIPNGTQKTPSSMKKLPDICAHRGIACCSGSEFLDWCRDEYDI